MFSKPTISFLFIIYFFCSFLTAQNKKDDIDILIEKASSEKDLSFIIKEVKNLSKTSPRAAITKYNEIILHAEQANFANITAEVNRQKGVNYFQLGEYNEAKKWTEKAIIIYRKTGNKTEQANTYNNLGAILATNNKLDRALIAFEQALNIGLELENKKSTADSYNNLGSFYFNDLDNPTKALDYFNKAEGIYNDIEAFNFIRLVQINKGNCYFKLNDFIKAKKQFTNALNDAKKNNKQNALANAYFGLGQIASKTNDKNAVEYYENALDIFKQKKNFRQIAKTNQELAGFYASNKEYKKAIFNDSIALSYYTKSRDYIEMNEVLYALANSYNQENNPQKAITLLKQQLAVKDSIHKNANTQQIDKLSLEFEEKLNNRKIEELVLQNAKNKERMWIFILALSLLILLLFFIHKKNNRIKKIELQLKENEQTLLKDKLKNKEKELKKESTKFKSQKEQLKTKEQQIKQFETEIKKLDHLKEKENREETRLKLMKTKILTQKDTETFKNSFIEVYPEFLKNLSNDTKNLTSGEYIICMLVKLGLSRLEISESLGISENSARKSLYRLRCKTDIEQESELFKYLKNI